MENKALHLIARIIPYALILAVIIGFTISILLQKVNFALNGLILGIPTIAAVILLLKIQKSDSDFSGHCMLFPFNQKSLLKIFLIIFTLIIIVTQVIPAKSTLFLILIIFIYCIILIQIFSKNLSPVLIIIEVVLTLLILVYTTTLTSGYYFGRTDIIPHVYFIDITSLTGHVISPTLSDYSYFPLYHIWIAAGSIITGFNSYTTLIILTCPAYIISVIFIYYLFNPNIKNQQIVLLTCLLYSISAIIVFYGTYVVTRTMAFLGFIILLYLFYKIKVAKSQNSRLIFESISILFIVYIILVHNVSTLLILLLLFIFLICEKIVDAPQFVNIKLLFFMLVLFISYWLFFAYTFTQRLIVGRLSIEKIETPIFIQNQMPFTPLFGAYFFIIKYLADLILLFFGIIGIFYLLEKKNSTYSAVFAIFALLTIILYIPNPLFSVWQIANLFDFERFHLLLIPFLTLMMAGGIWVVSKYLLLKKISVKIICLIILSFFIIYSCSSISLSHYNQPPSDRVSFTAEELIGFNFITQNIPLDSHIFSDYYIETYFHNQPFTTNIVENPANLSLNRGYFIFAVKKFRTDGLYFSKTGGSTETDPEYGMYSYLPTNENIQTIQSELPSKNKIYSSNSIEMFNG